MKVCYIVFVSSCSFSFPPEQRWRWSLCFGVPLLNWWNKALCHVSLSSLALYSCHSTWHFLFYGSRVAVLDEGKIAETQTRQHNICARTKAIDFQGASVYSRKMKAVRAIHSSNFETAFNCSSLASFPLALKKKERHCARAELNVASVVVCVCFYFVKGCSQHFACREITCKPGTLQMLRFSDSIYFYLRGISCPPLAHNL